MANQDLDLYAATTVIEDTDLIPVYKKSGDSLWRKMTGSSLKNNLAGTVREVDLSSAGVTLTTADRDRLILADASGAGSNRAITLPAEATAGDGWGVKIRLVGVDSGFKVQINNDTPTTEWNMHTVGETRHPVTDGTDWFDADQESLVAATTSSDPGLAFDTWRTPNADRPTLVTVRASSVTDGASNGSISVQVDESGGTTSDYVAGTIFADKDAGASVSVFGTVTFFIPAGGSYRIENTTDPNAINSINDHREFTL